jgi:hypothetical protein
MLESLVNAHLAKNARMLLVNTFHVIDNLLEIKVPDFILPCLKTTFRNYNSSKKVQRKALASRFYKKREDFDQIQIG